MARSTQEHGTCAMCMVVLDDKNVFSVVRTKHPSFMKRVLMVLQAIILIGKYRILWETDNTEEKLPREVLLIRNHPASHKWPKKESILVPF